jgi:hypothetical protein
MENSRLYALISKLANYVSSPSLKHIRDSENIHKLAEDILKTVDRSGSNWTKWEGHREDIARSAAPCWVPIEDLTTFLNSLPGPPLTRTDVAQRLRAIWEEPYSQYPNDALKASCNEIYVAEKAAGTEMSAIIGALQEHVDLEEQRLALERAESYRRNREEERVRLQQRFLSGADCGWTPVDHSAGLFCRRNGRAFRTEQRQDKRWKLLRVNDHQDHGTVIGIYAGRREMNKTLEKIAYEPEPRR